MKNIWDYDTKPLTDLLEAIVDNRGKTVPTTETGRILIATNCVTNNTLFPVYEKVRFISDETYETWFRAHPIPGDIIFVNKGTPGKVCMVPDPIEFCIAQDMIALRANDKKIYNKYLFAVLRSERIQKQIYNTNVGDVIPHFKKQFLDQLLIPIPPREIQEFIGNLYYQLSYKIELNKQINDNLEQQAQALYKSWFVDFDPFMGGEFVESEAGMIPKGWRVGNLLDVAELYDSRRKPLSGMQRSAMKKIYPYYGATSIMDYVDNYIFDGIYLLMGEDGSVVTDEGYPFLQYVSGKFWPNNHAHVMQGKNGFTTEMLHCFLLKKNISEIVTGAVQAKISQGNMKKISLVIAPDAILNEFTKILDGIYAKIRCVFSENLKLEIMRDSLLPKLMSGELKINEIDC